MPANRSEEFYFQRGDVVIQVENTIFKLHKDILERHSGFFRDMFSAPSSDVTEGTDANPLHLPTALCSPGSFIYLCKLMYPSVMGNLPTISVVLLDVWEPVLKATTALQMSDTRAFIFARLAKSYDPAHSPRTLALCSQYKDAPKSLKSDCLRTLAYRRRPISLEETTVMGIELVYRVGSIREKVRSLISSSSGLVIHVHKLCKSRTCRGVISRLLRDNLQGEASDEGSWLEIFDVQDPFEELCPLCALYSTQFMEALKFDFFNKMVDDHFRKKDGERNSSSDSGSESS